MIDAALNQPVWLDQARAGSAWISRQMSIIGGIIMLLLATMTVVSIIGRAMFGIAVEGDYELVESGLAISVFLFLPECHLKKGHVVVDIFTGHLSDAIQEKLEGLGEILFFIASLVFAWRLTISGFEAHEYLDQSMILEIPLWIAYVPGVISMLLVAINALDRVLQTFFGLPKSAVNQAWEDTDHD